MLSLVFASGCGTSPEASNTTVEAPAAPTTTVATTTSVSATTVIASTVVTSTAVPTTAVPTVLAQTDLFDVDAVEAGSVEEAVLARLAEFTAAEDRCFESPVDCDPVALVNEYGDGPDGQLAQYTVALTQEWAAAGYRVLDQSLVEHRVRELSKVSDEQVLVVECFRNAAVLVDANENVVDGETGFGERLMEWSKREDRWIVTIFVYSLYDESNPAVAACAL